MSICNDCIDLCTQLIKDDSTIEPDKKSATNLNPVEIKNYDDYVAGTRYPKMKKRPVWFVYIEITKELLDDIFPGHIAGTFFVTQHFLD